MTCRKHIDRVKHVDLLHELHDCGKQGTALKWFQKHFKDAETIRSAEKSLISPEKLPPAALASGCYCLVVIQYW